MQVDLEWVDQRYLFAAPTQHIMQRISIPILCIAAITSVFMACK